jgi:hypothetical protein
MRTRQGQAALKTVDKKIQSLLRKKAWRDGIGTPIHMGNPDFVYPIPDDPLTAALKKIAALSTDQLASPHQCSAVVIAMDALAKMESSS